MLNLAKDVHKDYISTVNCSVSTGKIIKYIVIHYVGATGDAKNNAIYFTKVHYDSKGKRIFSSAHYFVGFNGDIWQAVDDGNIAWHCGTAANAYKHNICRNTNSIGIELCCRLNADNKTWRFEKATVNKAAKLTAMLMHQYDIPLKNIVRHYDVTGKNCPEPFVRDKKAWNDFLGLVKQEYKAVKGKYVVASNCCVRNDNLQIIKKKEDLPGYLKEMCEERMNGATILKDSVVKIKTIKQDTSGNIWGVTPTGQYLPIYNRGVVKMQKKS